MSLRPSAFFDSKDVLAIAHRGGDGAGRGKRNTMAAFEAAYRMGYRYFETDVFVSKDGEVMINHGVKSPLEFFSQSGYSNRHLETLNYKQIRSKYKVGGEPMPLIIDIFKSFTDVKIFIDPKTDNVVEPLADLIKKHKLLDRVCVGSFHYERIKTISELLGGWDKACTSFINRALARPIRYKFEGSSLQIPHWRLSSEVVQKIHNHGLRALSWTPNDQEAIAHSLNIGVDGIISDNVDLLKQSIDNYKQADK